MTCVDSDSDSPRDGESDACEETTGGSFSASSDCAAGRLSLAGEGVAVAAVAVCDIDWRVLYECIGVSKLRLLLVETTMLQKSIGILCMLS